MPKHSSITSGSLAHVLFILPRNVDSCSVAGIHCFHKKYSENQPVNVKWNLNRILSPSPSTTLIQSRRSSSSSETTNQHSLNSMAQERLGHAMQMYEDFVGLTEVKEAQNKVVTVSSFMFVKHLTLNSLFLYRPVDRVYNSRYRF